jgi:hypothetical protein
MMVCAHDNLSGVTSDKRRRALLVWQVKKSVPWWIKELAGLPVDSVVARAELCAPVLSDWETIDLPVRKSNLRYQRIEETPSRFDQLCQVIACLAYLRDDGVDFEGEHFSASMDRLL